MLPQQKSPTEQTGYGVHPGPGPGELLTGGDEVLAGPPGLQRAGSLCGATPVCEECMDRLPGEHPVDELPGKDRRKQIWIAALPEPNREQQTLQS